MIVCALFHIVRRQNDFGLANVHRGSEPQTSPAVRMCGERRCPAGSVRSRSSSSSGVGPLIDARYATNPDWRPSGLHVIDLDDDGNLDLFLKGNLVFADGFN